jgi:hypothetical protein
MKGPEMTHGPLLIAETPNAGKLGHRYVVSPGSAVSELTAVHYVDRSRGLETKRGDDFLAVSSRVRQVGTGREDMPQTLVLAGVDVAELDEAAVEKTFGLLKGLLARLDPLALAAEWPHNSTGLVIEREEIAGWQREVLSEPLPARALRAPREVRPAETGEEASDSRRKWLVAAGVLLVAVPVAILASGGLRRPEPASAKPEATEAHKEPAKLPLLTENDWQKRVVAFLGRSHVQPGQNVEIVPDDTSISDLLAEAHSLPPPPSAGGRGPLDAISSTGNSLEKRKSELEYERTRRRRANEKALKDLWSQFRAACDKEPQRDELKKLSASFGGSFWKYPKEVGNLEESRERLKDIVDQRSKIIDSLAGSKLTFAEIPPLVARVVAYEKIPGEPADLRAEKLWEALQKDVDRLVSEAGEKVDTGGDVSWSRLRTVKDHERVVKQISEFKASLTAAGARDRISGEKWLGQLDGQRQKALADVDEALYGRLQKAVDGVQAGWKFDGPDDRAAHQRACKSFEDLRAQVNTYLNPPKEIVANYPPAMSPEVRDRCSPLLAGDATASATGAATGSGAGPRASPGGAKVPAGPNSEIKVTLDSLPSLLKGAELVLTIVSRDGRPKMKEPAVEFVTRKEIVFDKLNCTLTPLDLITIQVEPPSQKSSLRPIRLTVLYPAVYPQSFKLQCDTVGECALEFDKVRHWPAAPLAEPWRKKP